MVDQKLFHMTNFHSIFKNLTFRKATVFTSLMANVHEIKNECFSKENSSPHSRKVDFLGANALVETLNFGEMR